MPLSGLVSPKPLTGIGSGRGAMGDLPLPGDLVGESFVQADARLPAEVARQFRGIGEGVTLIAGAGRLPADDGAAARDLFELAKDVPHRRRLATADVVGLA